MRVDLYLTCNLYFITVAYHYKNKSGNYLLVYAYGSNNKIGLLFYFGGWSRSGAGVRAGGQRDGVGGWAHITPSPDQSHKNVRLPSKLHFPRFYSR